MSNKLPRFMVSENPMLDEQREFVMHMQEPFLMAEVFFHDSPEDQEQFKASMVELAELEKIPTAMIGKGRIQEDYFSLMAIHFFSAVEANQDQHDRLVQTVQDMADWYGEYLQWEEDNDPFND